MKSRISDHFSTHNTSAPMQEPPETRLVELCHDLRQHVAAGLILTEQLRAATAPDAPSRTPIDQIRRQFDDLSRILRSEVQSAGERVALVDLLAVVEQCAATAKVAFGVEVELRIEAAPVVRGRAAALSRAVGNLVENAARATPSGRVLIRLAADPDQAVVEVQDDGPGLGLIPRQSGLGLHQARTTAAFHHGGVELGPAPERGTLARLRLPLGDEGDRW